MDGQWLHGFCGSSSCTPQPSSGVQSTRGKKNEDSRVSREHYLDVAEKHLMTDYLRFPPSRKLQSHDEKEDGNSQADRSENGLSFLESQGYPSLCQRMPRQPYCIGSSAHTLLFFADSIQQKEIEQLKTSSTEKTSSKQPSTTKERKGEQNAASLPIFPTNLFDPKNYKGRWLHFGGTSVTYQMFASLLRAVSGAFAPQKRVSPTPVPFTKDFFLRSSMLDPSDADRPAASSPSSSKKNSSSGKDEPIPDVEFFAVTYNGLFLRDEEKDETNKKAREGPYRERGYVVFLHDYDLVMTFHWFRPYVVSL